MSGLSHSHGSDVCLRGGEVYDLTRLVQNVYCDVVELRDRLQLQLDRYVMSLCPVPLAASFTAHSSSSSSSDAEPVKRMMEGALSPLMGKEKREAKEVAKEEGVAVDDRKDEERVISDSVSGDAVVKMEE